MNFMKPIFLLLFFTNLLFANDVIIVDNNTSYKEILSKSEIFIDQTQKLSFEQIQKHTFVKNDEKILGYGYSPPFTVWVKFTLKNNTEQPLHKILEYLNTNTTHIEFYDGNTVSKDGLFQLNQNRDTISPNFDIILEPNETKTYYLKASSKITTLIIKLKVWDKKLFEKESNNHQMILAMFFAAMSILAIYNLFIYFFTKDKSYIFYVTYMLGAIFHQLAYTGFGNIYLFSQELSIFIVTYASLVVALPLIAFAFLVKSFIKTDQYPIFHKILNISLAVFPFLLSIYFIVDDFAPYRNLFSMLLLIFLIVLTIYASIKKNRQAHFVLIGWFMFAFSFIFMYFSSIGVVDIFEHFKYFVEIALLFEGLIFSVALADKINVLEQKKNEANMELILNQQLEQQRLKYQVKEKTKELQHAFEEKNLLLKELNHRVKNNMQTIISLIRLQTNEIKEESIKKIFETTYNRINAMSKLHELFDSKDKISNINANIYLQNLIDELKSGFESENIKINFDIQTTIKIEDAVYCGLIVNELVTNSLKYAFPDNNGTINIQFIEQSDNYILSIEDNGIGYNQQNTLANLGLTLINTLATKQLKGTIQKDTTNGVHVVVVWSKK
ncbi:MAG: hypothetical protein K8R39_09550 [Arcobacteraceae bacterium]|nr:hypothetical protein [Arcobacteraceae bacterium]